VNKLKRGIVMGLILVAGLILVSAVYAHFPGKGYRSGWFCNADIESVEKFQKDTLPLRDELITKRFEIRKEYNKEKPDSDRIATLEKEIIDIKTKIRKKAEEAGLPAWKGGKIGHGKMMGRGIRGAGCPGPGGW
jgi:hypothetical protein